jgi:hypothetical protein
MIKAWKWLPLVCLLGSGCYLLFPVAASVRGNQHDKEIAAPVPPEVEFPEGQRLLGPAIKEWVRGYSQRPEVLRADLYADDWEMDRDEGTKRILGRAVAVTIYYRGVIGCGSDQTCRPGQCFEWACKLYEEEQGGGHWGRPHLNCPAQDWIQKVTCDSVEKRPDRSP